MTFKAYVWGMRFLVLVSAIALMAVLSYFDPETGGFPALILFYATLILFLSGLATIFLLFLRRKMLGLSVAQEATGLSFRQGFLLAIMGAAILILQGLKMLVWWDGLLVVAGIFLVELYFLSRT